MKKKKEKKSEKSFRLITPETLCPDAIAVSSPYGENVFVLIHDKITESRQIQAQV